MIQKMQQMSGSDWAVLILVLMLTLGSWGATVGTWKAMIATPVPIAALLALLAGNIATAFGINIRGPRVEITETKITETKPVQQP